MFGQRSIFSHEEQRHGRKYSFEVLTGYYYEDDSRPVPLLTEGIEEVLWFDIKKAKTLHLTPVARKAVEFLEYDPNHLFLSKCVHHLWEILRLAKSQEGSGMAICALKNGIEKVIKSLYLINETVKK